jgi:hypothetical protein
VVDEVVVAADVVELGVVEGPGWVVPGYADDADLVLARSNGTVDIGSDGGAGDPARADSGTVDRVGGGGAAAGAIVGVVARARLGIGIWVEIVVQAELGIALVLLDAGEVADDHLDGIAAVSEPVEQVTFGGSGSAGP